MTKDATERPDLDQPWQPQHRGPRYAEVAPPRWRRRVVVSLTSAAMVCALVLIGGGAYSWHVLGSIKRVKVGDLGTRPAETNEALNILLIGSDTRDGDNVEYGRRVAGARGDVTLLLHLAADRKSATAVSIPRDSMVQLPTCTRPDGSTAPAQLEMFNAAYSLGGPTCVIRAVEALTGVFVNHFVVIDFEGFTTMVDALGTVDICVPRDVDDLKSKLKLTAGRHEVDGRTALAYVRNRSLDATGDLGRVKRQQAFLSAMVQKATSAGILTNPGRLVSFIQAVADSMTADEDLSPKKMSSIANSVRGLGLGKIQFLTVPTEAYPLDRNRLQWTGDAEPLWAAIRDDGPLPGQEPTPSPSAGGVPTVRTAPGAIRVDVVNGTDLPGLAAKAAADLRVQGFEVRNVGNSSRTDYASSVVRHDPGYDQSGRTLSTSVLGSTAQAVPDLGGVLQLVVGRDYAGVQPVRVVAAPAGGSGKDLQVRRADQDVCG